MELSFETEGLEARFPKVCACCLGFAHKTMKASVLAPGGKALEQSVEWPVCAPCRAHFTSSYAPWKLALGVGALAFLGALWAAGFPGPWSTRFALVSGGAALLIGALRYLVFRGVGARGPRCVQAARALDCAGPTEEGKYRFVFFNNEYGRRFVELNRSS